MFHLTPNRITAATVDTLSVMAVAGQVTASTLTRTLAGPVVRYGDYGRTSAGRLRVRPGALTWPAELYRVKLTEEHHRDRSRGHLVNVIDDPRPGGVVRAALRVSDGPLGDAALREAADRTRDGFSFDIIDAVIEGDEIVAGQVVAIGQVGIPAYEGMRIDTIAASQPTEGNRNMLTAQELAELNQLAAMDAAQLTDEQRGRLAELTAKLNAGTSPAAAAAAPASSPTVAPAATGAADPAAASTPAPAAPSPVAGAHVAASIPAVPTGQGGTPAPATTQPRTDALGEFVSTIVAALSPGGGGAAAITAALADVTHSGAGANIEAPAWSGELWSGVAYEPEFTGLLNSGSLTNWSGQGWRFVQKPGIQDYAGDKAAVPSGPVTTEPSSYEAARMAVGHDIDRKFYDFPNEGFLRAYVEAVRESWAIRLDEKVRAWIIANAVAVPGASATSLLSAAALAVRAVKRRRVGRATFVVVNDGDMDDLMDITNNTMPAFLSLWNIDPSNWVSSPDAPAGLVLAGSRNTATVRTLPGSPIRVSAQHIANGGIDEAFFGYWAIEEHHTSGIASVAYAPGA